MATENVLGTQVALGVFGSLLLQWLKNSKWASAINDNSTKLNHVILLLTSAVGAVGVHMIWNASAHSLTITGLDAATILASLWLWARQWAYQYAVNLVHRVATKP